MNIETGKRTPLNILRDAADTAAPKTHGVWWLSEISAAHGSPIGDTWVTCDAIYCRHGLKQLVDVECGCPSDCPCRSVVCPRLGNWHP